MRRFYCACPGRPRQHQRPGHRSQAGPLVQGAQVVLLNPATGVAQHTVTTSAGLYTFISLNPGVYQVTASQKGFKSVAQDKITVTVDQVTEVNISAARWRCLGNGYRHERRRTGRAQQLDRRPR